MKLETWPKSLPSYLTRWQIGLPLYRHELDESPRFCTNVLRHIFKGRATRNQAGNIRNATEFDPNLDLIHHNLHAIRPRKKAKRSLQNKQWTRLPLSPQDELLNQYIVIKREDLTHFYTPEHNSHPSPCRHKFSLPTWRSYDVWHAKPSVPVMEPSPDRSHLLLKVPNSVVLLRRDGRGLSLYCLNSGRKLEDYELDQEYDDVVVHEEENLIYVTARVAKEYLGFSYPPLKPLYRVIIPWGDGSNSWRWLDGFERLGGLGLTFISRKNRVELYDYQELLEMNSIDTSAPFGDGNSADRGRTIVLNDKPEPLSILETNNGYLILLSCLPPKVIVRKRKGVEEFGQKRTNFSSNFRTASGGTGSDKVLFVHGLPHGFDVLDFSEKEDIYQIIFTTKDIHSRYGLYSHKDKTETDESFERQRRPGLRNPKRRISYAELESSSEKQVWGVGYDDSSDLIACCLFSDGILSPIILDNNTTDLALFLQLDPVKISVPEISDSNLACTSVIVHFYEYFLSVRLKLYDLKSFAECEHLYICTMFEESMEG